MVNATNIVGISEDLQYIVQSDIKNRVFQTQRMLVSRMRKVDLIFSYFLSLFLFSFQFIFLYSIFRTRVRVRVTRSRYHTADHTR